MYRGGPSTERCVRRTYSPTRHTTPTIVARLSTATFRSRPFVTAGRTVRVVKRLAAMRRTIAEATSALTRLSIWNGCRDSPRTLSTVKENRPERLQPEEPYGR